MTLLDVALYRSNEGQLTRTICSANATLHSFLELKVQSTRLLELCLVDDSIQFASIVGKAVSTNGGMTTTTTHTAPSQTGGGGSGNSSSNIHCQYHRQYQRFGSIADRMSSIERFARACQDCSRDAIRRLTTDKNSMNGANLPAATALDPQGGLAVVLDHHPIPVGIPHPPTESSSSSSSNTNKSESVVERNLLNGILSPSSSLEAERRSSPFRRRQLRRHDLWESPAMHCPDYVWADDAHSHCQRLVRNLAKHEFLSVFTSVHDHAAMGGGGGNSSSGGGGGNSGGGNGGNPTESNTNSPHTGGESSTTAPWVLNSATQTVVDNIVTLLRYDLPMRFQQFKCALESDGAVSKRLYLIKMEYRAPFRAFLESHGMVQRNPKLETVERYLKMQQEEEEGGNGVGEGGEDDTVEGDGGGDLESWKQCKKDAETRKQECVKDKGFVKALILEKECEGLEMEMARAMLPFCELARVLDGKGVRLVEVAGLVTSEEVPDLQEVLRRLKSSLCRKPGADACPGIRPILLDFQGISRDPSPNAFEIDPFNDQPSNESYQEDTIFTPITTENEIRNRVKKCCSQLQTLHDITKTKGGFYMDKNESPVSPSVIRECSNLDTESLINNYLDWYRKCLHQRALSTGVADEVSSPSSDGGGGLQDDDNSTNDGKRQSFQMLTETIRLAEMEVSIAKAPKQALTLVRKQLDRIEKDRMKRFEVLQEMAGEVCLREMDFRLRLMPPKRDLVLELPEIKSAIGILSPTLQLAGEPLPVG